MNKLNSNIITIILLFIIQKNLRDFKYLRIIKLLVI
jgi:hypothetical protein